MRSVLDRLRSNLLAAGIPFDEHELDELAEAGMLEPAAALDRWMTTGTTDTLPDHLDPATGTPAQSPSTRSADPDAGGRSGLATRPAGSVLPDTLAQLAPLLAERAVSPVELLERSLERIAARDAELNVFHLVLEDRARASARRAEDEIRRGEHRGPLHGIPVAVKDLLAMRGLPNAAGSRLLAETAVDFDAAAIERLEAAGAVIVGRTRMPEFAYSPGSNNPHYGPTRNPWNLEHDAGGSSSGSAVAVAEGLAVVALGSDTGGSIRIPSAHCGIVGLKPTHGRVSLHGAVPLSWSLDHLGPMTRCVADAATLLAAIAGVDARDPRTRSSAEFRPAAAAESAAPSSPMRIAVVREDGSGAPLASADALAGWRRGLEVLAAWGATLDEIDLPEIAGLRTAGAAILAIEAASFHQRALRERPELLGGFLRRRLLAAHAFGPHSYVRAEQLRATLRQSIERRIAGFDLLTTPSMPASAPPLGTPSPTLLTLPFNTLGWPAITLPVGLGADRLPLGIQLVARPWREDLTLVAAAAVEARLAGVESGVAGRS